MLPMAARRLIAILLALLVVSSFAAALAPREEADQTDGTGSEPTTAPTTTDGEELGGALVERRIPPDPKQPVVLELEQGDQLQLLVAVPRPAPVRVPALGESSYATPGTPARFDLLLREPGRYPVAVGDGTTVGRIEVGTGG